MSKPPKERWLSVSEATQHVPVNRLKLFRAVKAGKLKSRRFGWVYLIKYSSLLEYKKSL